MSEGEPDWLPDWALKAFYVVAGIIVFPHILVSVLGVITGYQANPPPGYVKVDSTHRWLTYDGFVPLWIANLYYVTSTLAAVLGALIVIWGIIYAVVSVLRRAQP